MEEILSLLYLSFTETNLVKHKEVEDALSKIGSFLIIIRI